MEQLEDVALSLVVTHNKTFYELLCAIRHQLALALGTRIVLGALFTRGSCVTQLIQSDRAILQD